MRHILAKIERNLYGNKTLKKDENKFSHQLKKNSFVFIDDLFNSTEQKVIFDHFSKEQKLTPIYTNHDDFNLNNPPKNVSTGYIKLKIF